MNFPKTRARAAAACLLLIPALLVGCSGRYLITTTSGAKIVTRSRPKRVDSLFVYRGAGGESNAISVLRVRSIEPYSKAGLGKQLKPPELQ